MQDVFSQASGAISARGLTGAVRGRERIRAKATRRMPKAAKIPNPSAAMHAQINIAKFNKSAIQFRLGHTAPGPTGGPEYAAGTFAPTGP